MKIPAAMAIATWLIASTVSAAEHTSLRDPFTRPASRPISARGLGAMASDVSPATLPELRAILLAGSKSMVNLGGTMVRIGEAIDGYRLLRVSQRQAVFSKDGTNIALSLDRSNNDNNEGKHNESR